MLDYLLRRIMLMIPTLLGITLITFAIIHLAPGDPAELSTGGMMNAESSKKIVMQMRELYGLDKPILVQYIDWLKRLARFDFGDSFAPDGRPVAEKILSRLPNTIILNIASILLIYIIAVPIGIFSAVKHNSTTERIIGVFLFMFYSAPGFWVALMLLKYFGVHWGVLPLGGMESDIYDLMPTWTRFWDRVHHLILPTVCLSLGALAGLSRYMRGSMLENIRQDYVRTARAKGLSEFKVIFKHVLRNSLITIVTLFAGILPGLIGGSVIMESIFSWPGVGRLFFTALQMRDYPVIMASTVISATLVLVALLITDLLYSLVDPRIRLK
ncbi:MAG: diguanylate cyclase [Candidatus Muiribacterium halophilum]|uniref:Diguanylate cyclase n=1 Tax=Muiribacterium halophilum TaxID=2053465 RepID=A0A2N5ZMU6_MUIH1|nr:MAG: diguanylate cyclase [Candidatus Muirbacterium halophilum]